jgi:hypothetical protein
MFCIVLAETFCCLVSKLSAVLSLYVETSMRVTHAATHFLLKWRWHESCRQMYAKYLYLNIALVKKCEKTANGQENDRLKHE